MGIWIGLGRHNFPRMAYGGSRSETSHGMSTYAEVIMTEVCSLLYPSHGVGPVK